MNFDAVEQMKSVIQSEMKSAQKQQKQAVTEADRLYLEGRLDTLTKQLKTLLSIESFIKEPPKKEIMENNVKRLVSKALWLEELPNYRQRESWVEGAVLEAVKELDTILEAKAGNSVVVDPSVIKYEHLNTKLGAMRKRGKIPPYYRVFRNKKQNLFGITVNIEEWNAAHQKPKR